MAKSKFSETQKIAIQAAYDAQRITGKSSQAATEFVAKEMGVHWQTIRKIIQGYKPSAQSQEIIKDIKKHQADKIDHIINQILSDFDSSGKTLKGLTPGQVSLTVGTLIDKVRLLRGEDVTKIEISEVGDKIQKRLIELQHVREALQKSLQTPEIPESN